MNICHIPHKFMHNGKRLLSIRTSIWNRDNAIKTITQAEQELQNAHEKYTRYREFYRVHIQNAKKQTLFENNLNMILNGKKGNGLMANYVNLCPIWDAYYKLGAINITSSTEFEVPSMSIALNNCESEIYVLQKKLIKAREELAIASNNLDKVNSEQKELCLKNCKEAQKILDEHDKIHADIQKFESPCIKK